MTPIEEIIQLAKDAEAKLSASLNAPDVIPFATRALSIIESHAELQPEFEREFMNMSDYAPNEFVEVCMHALLWSNVKHEFEKRERAAIERNDWRVAPVFRRYLEAFETDWEDAKDFYAELFGSHSLRRTQ